MSFSDAAPLFNELYVWIPDISCQKIKFWNHIACFRAINKSKKIENNDIASEKSIKHKYCKRYGSLASELNLGFQMVGMRTALWCFKRCNKRPKKATQRRTDWISPKHWVWQRNTKRWNNLLSRYCESKRTTFWKRYNLSCIYWCTDNRSTDNLFRKT